MLDWVRSLLRGRGAYASASDGYTIFTTEFDRVINADQIGDLVGGEAAFREYADEFDRALSRWRAAAEISAVEMVGKFPASEVRPATVASILVDHSRSMYGQRALLAIAIVEIATEFLGRIGVPTEVLGFTTQSWHGGRARKKWLEAGCRPQKPGRLCELLHIIYRTADDVRPRCTVGREEYRASRTSQREC